MGYEIYILMEWCAGRFLPRVSKVRTEKETPHLMLLGCGRGRNHRHDEHALAEPLDGERDSQNL